MFSCDCVVVLTDDPAVVTGGSEEATQNVFGMFFILNEAEALHVVYGYDDWSALQT